MAFRRYNWFFEYHPQKTIDEELQQCPFCGESPNWLLDVKKGINSNFTCMCEKCSGKLYADVYGTSMNNNIRVVDVGEKNINNLMLDQVYHLQSLKTIALNASSNMHKTTQPTSIEANKAPVSLTPKAPTNTESTSDYQTKKKTLVVVSIITVICILSLILLSVFTQKKNEIYMYQTGSWKNGVEFEVVDYKTVTEIPTSFGTYKTQDQYLILKLNIYNGSSDTLVSDSRDVWLTYNGKKISQQDIVCYDTNGYYDIRQSPTVTKYYYLIFEIGNDIPMSELKLVISNGKLFKRDSLVILLKNAPKV